MYIKFERRDVVSRLSHLDLDKGDYTYEQQKNFGNEVSKILRNFDFTSQEVLQILDISGPGLVPKTLLWIASLSEYFGDRLYLTGANRSQENIRAMLSHFLMGTSGIPYTSKGEIHLLDGRELSTVWTADGKPLPDVSIAKYPILAALARSIFEIVLVKGDSRLSAK